MQLLFHRTNENQCRVSKECYAMIADKMQLAAASGEH